MYYFSEINSTYVLLFFGYEICLDIARSDIKQLSAAASKEEGVEDSMEI
jgi:hypothetical protein